MPSLPGKWFRVTLVLGHLFFRAGCAVRRRGPARLCKPTVDLAPRFTTWRRMGNAEASSATSASSVTEEAARVDAEHNDAACVAAAATEPRAHTILPQQLLVLRECHVLEEGSQRPACAKRRARNS